MGEALDFGTKRTVHKLDEEGSVKETVNNYKNGQIVGATQEIYSIRKRVSSDLEEAAVYHNFAKQYHADPTMLNPSTSVEGNHSGKDHYYVICTYTRKIG